MYSIILSLSLFVSLCAAGHPWVGEPRTEDWWVTMHHQLLNLTAKHKEDLKVIFFGDSITQGWAANGHEIWRTAYEPRHAYNYGIGGDKTEHLIWRMENGEFDGLNSHVVVLKIGTNNLGSNTEEDIAKGIKEVVDQVLRRQSHTRVLLLGILPREPTQTEEHVEKINSIISKYADDKRVFFLDMSPHFQNSPGHEVADMYVPDKVHLSTKGYQKWHDVMESLFVKLYEMK